MKRIVSVMTVALLTSCALSPEQQAAVANQQQRFLESRPRCYDSSSCERIWSAARNWVINNCGMKIQNITDGYIETYNSTDGSTDIHCLVTKDPLPDNGYVLNVTIGCANVFGCVPNVSQAAFAFNSAVQAAAPVRVAVESSNGADHPASLVNTTPTAASENRFEAERAFLGDNAKRPDIVTTPSGLQYQVIAQGTGAKPTSSNTVMVHYVGRLVDGTKFDSSYDHNKPAQVQLTKVIPGWTEALQLMPVGSKYKLYVPSSLAYGEAGVPAGGVKPFATLVFEIELLQIVR